MWNPINTSSMVLGNILGVTTLYVATTHVRRDSSIEFIDAEKNVE
jgi:hypothetical protein